MLVIVGHGPGIVGKRLGPWLDRQTVVRLKSGERPNAEDWGTRTDYLCASVPGYWETPTEIERWILTDKKTPKGPWRVASSHWLDHFKTFDPSFPKPSTGLKAIFCAIEFLDPKEIGLVGFDRVLRPDVPTSKWFHEQGKYLYGHDAHAEHRCLHSLGVKFTEI